MGLVFQKRCFRRVLRPMQIKVSFQPESPLQIRSLLVWLAAEFSPRVPTERGAYRLMKVQDASLNQNRSFYALHC